MLEHCEIDFGVDESGVYGAMSQHVRYRLQRLIVFKESCREGMSEAVGADG